MQTMQRLNSFASTSAFERENPEYASVEAFLRRVAALIGLEFQKVDQLVHVRARRPLFILTLPECAPTVGSFLLIGHYDVAPVSSEHWTHEPFGAELVDGRIYLYARGAQDMKCVSIAYLCALDRLIHSQPQDFCTSHSATVPPHSAQLHMIFTPDNEIGGPTLSRFVLSPAFRSLRPAFALNAGHCSAYFNFRMFHAERYRTKTRITLSGTSEHGDELPSDTAGEKLSSLLDCIQNVNADGERSVRRALQPKPNPT